jgi:hypothetical protein
MSAISEALKNHSLVRTGQKNNLKPLRQVYYILLIHSTRQK